MKLSLSTKCCELPSSRLPWAFGSDETQRTYGEVHIYIQRHTREHRRIGFITANDEKQIKGEKNEQRVPYPRLDTSSLTSPTTVTSSLILTKLHKDSGSGSSCIMSRRPRVQGPHCSLKHPMIDVLRNQSGQSQQGPGPKPLPQQQHYRKAKGCAGSGAIPQARRPPMPCTLSRGFFEQIQGNIVHSSRDHGQALVNHMVAVCMREAVSCRLVLPRATAGPE